MSLWKSTAVLENVHGVLSMSHHGSGGTSDAVGRLLLQAGSCDVSEEEKCDVVDDKGKRSPRNPCYRCSMVILLATRYTS